MYVLRSSITIFVLLMVLSSAVCAGKMNSWSGYGDVYHREKMRCYWYEAEALAPHNAAARVLEFSRELDLSHEQMSRIVSLVEDYDRDNRYKEKEWEVARRGLYNLLRGEEIDSALAVEYADNMTRLEFYLWQEFIDHLQQVKEILTDTQKRSLRKLWEIKCRPRDVK